jgi:hypothetical protein
MLTNRIPVLRSQPLIGLSVLLIGIWAAWEIGDRIALQDLKSISYATLGFGVLVIVVTILRNWRLGFYLFLIWLLFEDLFRKYLGNNMAIYFAKDVLVGLVYVSLFVDIRAGRAKTFRPPFLLFLSLFLWLGVLQIFNSNSPHILYGLLGFKLYFYYIPLIFVGYALIDNDERLRKFLVVNGILAAVIGGIGIIQAIAGHSFLNPRVLAPEIRELGDLGKVTPLTNQAFSLPDSVFVSAGRFSFYLLVAAILTMGSAGYLLLYTKRNRTLIFSVFGIVGVATLLSGARGPLVIFLSSALVLSVGFLWGAPWRWQQAHRIVKAVRRTFIIGGIGFAALLLMFPEEAGSRIAFYTETLSPSSTAYQGTNRAWTYPLYNLELAFTNANWIWGNGIGTASLGSQYVAKLLRQRPLNIWVEEGFGNLIIEMGILAPFLWLLWSGALLIACWKVVNGLRQTRFFPIAFAIWWYAFLLLLPETFAGLSPYQNYINNVYLWLLVGILFRLPNLNLAPATPVPVPSRKAIARGGFQF